MNRYIDETSSPAHNRIIADSWAVQDASNLAAVLRSAIDMLDALRADPECQDPDQHPTMMLMADKIASLVRVQGFPTRLHTAYDVILDALGDADVTVGQVERVYLDRSRGLAA